MNAICILGNFDRVNISSGLVHVEKFVIYKIQNKYIESNFYLQREMYNKVSILYFSLSLPRDCRL